MQFKLSTNEKILSILNSLVGIGSILIANYCLPQVIGWAIAFAIILCVGTLVYLIFKTGKQSTLIKELQNKSIENTRTIEEQNEKINFIESLLNVPFFKKWNLFYTFMWRKAIKEIKNEVILNEIYIKRELFGPGKLKNNKILYRFKGECIGTMNKFTFCFAGLDSVSLNSLNLEVKDIRNNINLDFCEIKKKNYSENIKFIEIYFYNNKAKGDLFDIDITWIWPKTAYIKSDYFSVPNIYSITTKKIILELILSQDMNVKHVEIYKFGLDDCEPEKISHVYKKCDKQYLIEIENPELNADYITYYE